MSTDYSKWDRIAASLDEEEEEQRENEPLLQSAIGREEVEKIEKFRKRATKYIDDFLENPESIEQGAVGGPEIKTSTPFPRQDVIDFMCATLKWEPHIDNCYRHQDIIHVWASSPSLVKETPRICKVLYIITQSLKSKSLANAGEDIPNLYSVINTLEAARIHDGIVALFEKICTPTTPEAIELRKKYAKQDFAKEYMMAQMFGEDFRRFQEKKNGVGSKPRDSVCPDWCSIL